MTSQSETNPPTISERWDIAVALFPFTEIAIRKPRPILILSNSTFNAANKHVIAAMITTASHSNWPDDKKIEDLEPTGLKHPSIIRFKVFTIPIDLVNNTIGALSTSDRGTIAAKVAGIFLG